MISDWVMKLISDRWGPLPYLRFNAAEYWPSWPRKYLCELRVFSLLCLQVTLTFYFLFHVTSELYALLEHLQMLELLCKHSQFRKGQFYKPNFVYNWTFRLCKDGIWEIYFGNLVWYDNWFNIWFKILEMCIAISYLNEIFFTFLSFSVSLISSIKSVGTK